jgi:uncharacterized membrane protein
MISLAVIVIVFLAGSLVLLYLKRRSIVGWVTNLVAGKDNTSVESKKPVTDPNYTNILQQRFENGEITAAEYEKMKNELG